MCMVGHNQKKIQTQKNQNQKRYKQNKQFKIRNNYINNYNNNNIIIVHMILKVMGKKFVFFLLLISNPFCLHLITWEMICFLQARQIEIIKKLFQKCKVPFSGWCSCIDVVPSFKAPLLLVMADFLIYWAQVTFRVKL